MNRSHLLLVAIPAFTFAFGTSACSASSSDDGPRSRATLHKADPLAFGCTYIDVTYSSYGTASKTDKTPKCVEGTRCDELKTPDSYTAYAGDDAFHSGEYFDHPENFIGTCAKHDVLPVPGPQSKCWSAPYLCDQDPNCVAIRDCVTGCGDDAGCSNECISNGEYEAASNFRATVECAPTTK